MDFQGNENTTINNLNIQSFPLWMRKSWISIIERISEPDNLSLSSKQPKWTHRTSTRLRLPTRHPDLWSYERILKKERILLNLEWFNTYVDYLLNCPPRYCNLKPNFLAKYIVYLNVFFVHWLDTVFRRFFYIFVLFYISFHIYVNKHQFLNVV